MLFIFPDHPNLRGCQGSIPLELKPLLTFSHFLPFLFSPSFFLSLFPFLPLSFSFLFLSSFLWNESILPKCVDTKYFSLPKYRESQVYTPLSILCIDQSANTEVSSQSNWGFLGFTPIHLLDVCKTLHNIYISVKVGILFRGGRNRMSNTNINMAPSIV